jgi:low affinity Fe/Cu permease
LHRSFVNREAHVTARRNDEAALLERISTRISAWTGSSWALLLSVAVVVAWAVTGPLFHYSDAWQLVINSVTNIVTFVMVFLIQRAQNKSSMATHLKLDALIAATQGASNRSIAIDELSEDELHRLHVRYQELANRHQGSESTSIAGTPPRNDEPDGRSGPGA